MVQVRLEEAVRTVSGEVKDSYASVAKPQRLNYAKSGDGALKYLF